MPDLVLAQSFPVQFASPLGAGAWSVLIGIPVGIIALYFLKLRRRPVQVPSTLLWRRSMEDLHVNSLFQRLRKNLLLFLQLLAVLLAMLALAGPRARGLVSQGQRYVVLLDNSASMSATDIKPTRLARAKEEAGKLIDRMESDDVMMIIAFSDSAKVVASYTGNRSQLRQRLASIPASQGTTSLREALQVASGLANPSSDKAARDLPQGVIATQQIPPKLFIYTDGGFPDLQGFSIGNMEPEVVVIGPAPPPFEAPTDPKKVVKSKNPSDNVGILALQVGRDEEKTDRYQVFGRVKNFRGEPVETEAKLYRLDPAKPAATGMLLDAVALKIDARSEQGFKFDLTDPGAAELEVRIDVKDDLPVDDHAYAVFGDPRKAQVLVVTPGNRYLVDTLKTATAAQLAEVEVVSPAEAKDAETARRVAAGRYDLIIYDNVRPDTPPEANTLYFGVMPPGKAYESARNVELPVILDWDNSHPMLQYIRDLSLVRIAKATTIELPAGATRLIDSNRGSLAFIASRSGYVDAVVGFSLLDGKQYNSDWIKYYSFPLFLLNSLRVLGNARESTGDELHLPGRPVVIRAESLSNSVTMTSPSGRSETLKRTPQGTFIYNGADVTGVYHAKWGENRRLAVAVNLFDERESDLAPRGIVPEGAPDSQADSYKIKIGYTPLKGSKRTTSQVKDWWKLIACCALGVLLLEWYIYNRRVYV